MTECSHQSKGSHQYDTKQDVGQVADRRPCQPSLDMCLFQSAAAAVYDCDDHKHHNYRLCPGSLQKLCSEAVVGHTYNREGSRLYHCYRMKQCRYGCRCHSCLGQPGRKRPHRCFYRKSTEAQHVDDQEQICLVAQTCHVHDTARYKHRGSPIGQNKNHADKCKGSTSQ